MVTIDVSLWSVCVYLIKSSKARMWYAYSWVNYSCNYQSKSLQRLQFKGREIPMTTSVNWKLRISFEQTRVSACYVWNVSLKLNFFHHWKLLHRASGTDKGSQKLVTNRAETVKVKVNMDTKKIHQSTTHLLSYHQFKFTLNNSNRKTSKHTWFTLEVKVSVLILVTLMVKLLVSIFICNTCLFGEWRSLASETDVHP